MTRTFKEAPRGHDAAPSIGHLELVAEHEEIRQRLALLRAYLHDAPGESVKERRADMDRVIAWLEEHVENHTRHEDRTLYRLVERHKGPSLTAALRVEHRLIIKGVDELRACAAEPVPDSAEFVRRLDNLIGLFVAHFEAEELVIFPIVDELKERGLHVDAT